HADQDVEAGAVHVAQLAQVEHHVHLALGQFGVQGAQEPVRLLLVHQAPLEVEHLALFLVGHGQVERGAVGNGHGSARLAWQARQTPWMCSAWWCTWKPITSPTVLRICWMRGSQNSCTVPQMSQIRWSCWR